MSRKQVKHREYLNHRQTLYVLAYVECLDGTKAAELAGYSKHSARDASKALQRHPTVRAEIDKEFKEKEREIKDRCSRAMEHAYAQATADIGDCFGEDGAPLPLAKMPRDARRAIASIEVEFEGVIMDDGTVVRRPKIAKLKLHDKRASQELFAKFAGKLQDRVEVDATTSFAELVLAAQRKREATADEPVASHEPDPE